ncbi:hypothetical protein HK097_008248 [Rhizophlyctis rosea]|uniref:Uncharacterized protein n=1 Tax=Rhizophlyctis rosea TaxID=64517 RepID=A0AAD5SAJ1_9FUNG|nr:hypothetical protein HK097_008248 [Rhizophlyctis rosea]
MSTQLCLAACPFFVYAEIAKYIAPGIYADADFLLYIGLQRLLNPTFALEIHREMKFNYK